MLAQEDVEQLRAPSWCAETCRLAGTRAEAPQLLRRYASDIHPRDPRCLSRRRKEVRALQAKREALLPKVKAKKPAAAAKAYQKKHHKLIRKQAGFTVSPDNFLRLDAA